MSARKARKRVSPGAPALPRNAARATEPAPVRVRGVSLPAPSGVVQGARSAHVAGVVGAVDLSTYPPVIVMVRPSPYTPPGASKPQPWFVASAYGEAGIIAVDFGVTEDKAIADVLERVPRGKSK